jgi:glutathione synthase/RimK-type ligase-like ATP-grasp enzyme
MTFSKRPIFIATSTHDNFAIRTTIGILVDRGYDVVLFDSDKVADGTHALCIRLNNARQTVIEYRGSEINLAGIGAAWYRRPNDFGLAKTPLRAYSLNPQYKELQEFLWRAIPLTAWLNSPWAMRKARNKLVQLKLATKLGLTIPQTVISNDWKDVQSISAPELIFKMPYPSAVYSENSTETARSVSSTLLRNAPESLPVDSLPYPGIWQAYIPKKREWRITVVGSSVTSTAIYTREDARDDWRIHQGDKRAVKFVTEPGPKDIEKKCIEFVKACGLKYGAFDFVEQPDGQVVFLEMNVNGQFLHELEGADAPVSHAVAKELMRTVDAAQ